MNPATATDDHALVNALLNGDEAAFLYLIHQYQEPMLRTCQIFVSDPAVAEEVVQDTWLDMLRGLKRFERRSSLKTWLFTILANNARTRGKREGRTIPFTALGDIELREDEPVVNPERFLPEGHQWAGHWAVGTLSEDQLSPGAQATLLGAFRDWKKQG